MNTSQAEPFRAIRVAFEGDMFVAYLDDAREIRVPLEWFPQLRDATDQERADFRLIGQGVGVHWPQLDEDLSIAGLLAPRARAQVRKVG